MAAASSFRLGQRVTIAGKGAGTIEFIGKTEFSDGEWIGIVLDEPKGKNNGSVQKKDGTTVRYFSCNDNHGLYVRAGQIESVIGDSQANITRSASNQSLKSQIGIVPPSTTPGVLPKPTGVPPKPTGLRAPTANPPTKPSGTDENVDQTGLPRSTQSTNEVITTERIPPSKEEVKHPPQPAPQSKTSTSVPPPTNSTTESSNTSRNSITSTSDSSDSAQILSLKSIITDLEGKLRTLTEKRREDFDKLKEFERTKLQLDQLQTYKREAQERMKELNDKLQHQENELKDTRDKFSAYRDEMNDTEIRIESLTLDLEMAEEKLETITLENTTLKEKYEEAKLELDIIKTELEVNGPNQVANGIQKKVDDERIIKMEQALIKLRDLTVTKQTENDKLKKESETFEHKIKVLTKENENAKTDIANMQATIADLKEQVDTCLGAQQMVDILTNKNLSLEDQVRELQETVDNLESLCEMDKEMEEHAKEVEHDLRENIDLLQNQLREKERQIEQLHYTIGDHERTILKFRETVKNMEYNNEQSKKQIEKYAEQLRLAGSFQSSEFKAKIVETKSYGEIIENELKKIEASDLSRYVQYLKLFLPEQFLKRGADHDCLLVYLLIQRLISKCDLLTNEIQKKTQKLDQINIDDVIKSNRAEQWSFTCKISQSLSIFRLILRKYLKALEISPPDVLRHLASTYQDLSSHEKSLDFLIELLQKDQLQDSISLNALDKTILFYEHIYKSHLSQEKFSMTNYLRDLTRIVLFSNDALQTDIQRIQILQKEHGQTGSDQSPFAALVKRLAESNEKMRAQISKINSRVPQEDDTTRSLTLDANTISSIELSIKNLDRLAKTFHEICSGLTTQILMLSDANERVNTQDIENIAYQACDKVYKKEDSGPYESLWNSMHETNITLITLGNSLENGSFESTPDEQSEKPKQAIYIIAEQLKKSMNEFDLIRGRYELKEEELLDLKKMLKLKQDEFSELNIRLSLNEKKIDSLQKELDEKSTKHKQILEEVRIDAQKKIRQYEEDIDTLQNDNQQFKKENTDFKERLRQLAKAELVKEVINKKTGVSQVMTGILGPTNDGKASPQRQPPSYVGSPANEQEVALLRNTIRLLKDELWELKMSRTSSELSKLQIPLKDNKTSEIADIYKNSTLLLNDLFSTIANYKITGENVAVKQELIRSKMKLVGQTASDLNNRLNQCQSNILPGSTIQTTMKTFSNPQFSKSLTQDRQLAAEIHLPGVNTGGELDITQEQYRTIMREAIGCI